MRNQGVNARKRNGRQAAACVGLQGLLERGDEHRYLISEKKKASHEAKPFRKLTRY
jgi:hypothetical protein